MIQGIGLLMISSECRTLIFHLSTTKLRDALLKKKNGKKRGTLSTSGRGVNPSSFFKPKFTGFSNHSEMDTTI